MPKAFMNCVRHGGRVRTVKLPSNRYVHVCYKNGHAYRGEVKHVSHPKRYLREPCTRRAFVGNQL